MKKDIIIPVVENVFIAAVQEWSDDFMEKVWYAYLVNDSDFNLEGVMVVSKAFGTIDGEMKKTSLLRHAFVEIPAVSVVKIEMIEKSVLTLNNEFMVTYFIDGTLYDKKFIFKANSINETEMEEVPILFVDGVIVRQISYNERLKNAIGVSNGIFFCPKFEIKSIIWTDSSYFLKHNPFEYKSFQFGTPIVFK